LKNIVRDEHAGHECFAGQTRSVGYFKQGIGSDFAGGRVFADVEKFDIKFPAAEGIEVSGFGRGEGELGFPVVKSGGDVSGRFPAGGEQKNKKCTTETGEYRISNSEYRMSKYRDVPRDALYATSTFDIRCSIFDILLPPW
jgi:hypothetical protein